MTVQTVRGVALMHYLHKLYRPTCCEEDVLSHYSSSFFVMAQYDH